MTRKGKASGKATGAVTRVTVYTRVSEPRDAAVRAGAEGETSTARQLAAVPRLRGLAGLDDRRRAYGPRYLRVLGRRAAGLALDHGRRRGRAD